MASPLNSFFSFLSYSSGPAGGAMSPQPHDRHEKGDDEWGMWFNGFVCRLGRCRRGLSAGQVAGLPPVQ